MNSERFPCTPGGSIARGRRRLRVLLVGLALLMVAVATVTWWNGRLWPGMLALAVAALAWSGWRLSGELDILWLELEEKNLAIQMRRQRRETSVLGARARRLSPQEIHHLEQLASSAGVTAATGGFDSHVLGELELFATDLDQAVLLEAEESRLVVTPDEPERFVAALAETPLLESID